jgi:predicted ArsR family transcriptional regulator
MADEQRDTDLWSFENKIIGLLGSKGPMTRGDMVAQLHSPRTTIYDYLARLMARNVVKREPIHADRRGRPKVLFSLTGGIVVS